MTGLGLLLLAIGIGDLVAGGLAGVPQRMLRAWAGLFGGLAAVFGTALLAGLTAPTLGLACLLAAGPLAAWLLPRAGRAQSRRSAIAAMTGLGTSAAAALILAPWFDAGSGGVLAQWLDLAPFSFLDGVGPDRAVLGGGVFVFLLASANGVVRATLALAGTDIQGGERRLQGDVTLALSSGY